MNLGCWDWSERLPSRKWHQCCLPSPLLIQSKILQTKYSVGTMYSSTWLMCSHRPQWLISMEPFNGRSVNYFIEREIVTTLQSTCTSRRIRTTSIKLRRRRMGGSQGNIWHHSWATQFQLSWGQDWLLKQKHFDMKTTVECLIILKVKLELKLSFCKRHSLFVLNIHIDETDDQGPDFFVNDYKTVAYDPYYIAPSFEMDYRKWTKTFITFQPSLDPSFMNIWVYIYFLKSIQRKYKPCSPAMSETEVSRRTSLLWWLLRADFKACYGPVLIHCWLIGFVDNHTSSVVCFN
jgi:hypothetical protein